MTKYCSTIVPPSNFPSDLQLLTTNSRKTENHIERNLDFYEGMKFLSVQDYRRILGTIRIYENYLLGDKERVKEYKSRLNNLRDVVSK